MEVLTWVSLGILGLGVILFFALAFNRSYRRHPAVEHYKDARDTLSGVEPVDDEKTPEDEGEGTSVGGMFSGFISVILVVVIGTSVLSSVNNQVEQAVNTTGVIGSELTPVTNMLPLVILLGALAVIFLILRILGKD